MFLRRCCVPSSMPVVCSLCVVEEGGHVEVTRLSCGDESVLIDVHGSRTYTGPGLVWDLPHIVLLSCLWTELV